MKTSTFFISLTLSVANCSIFGNLFEEQSPSNSSAVKLHAQKANPNNPTFGHIYHDHLAHNGQIGPNEYHQTNAQKKRGKAYKNKNKNVGGKTKKTEHKRPEKNDGSDADSEKSDTEMSPKSPITMHPRAMGPRSSTKPARQSRGKASQHGKSTTTYSGQTLGATSTSPTEYSSTGANEDSNPMSTQLPSSGQSSSQKLGATSTSPTEYSSTGANEDSNPMRSTQLPSPSSNSSMNERVHPMPTPPSSPASLTTQNAISSTSGTNATMPSGTDQNDEEDDLSDSPTDLPQKQQFEYRQGEERRRCADWEDIHRALKRYLKFESLRNSKKHTDDDTFLTNVAVRPRLWPAHAQIHGKSSDAMPKLGEQMPILDGQPVYEQYRGMELTFAMLKVKDAFKWPGVFGEEPLKFVNKALVEKVEGWTKLLENFLQSSPRAWTFRGTDFDGNDVATNKRMMMVARKVLGNMAKNNAILEGKFDDIPELPLPIVKEMGSAIGNEKQTEAQRHKNEQFRHVQLSERSSSVNSMKNVLKEKALEEANAINNNEEKKVIEKKQQKKQSNHTGKENDQLPMLVKRWKQVEKNLRKQLEKNGIERYKRRQQIADPYDVGQLIVRHNGMKQIILIPREDEVVPTVYNVVSTDGAKVKALGETIGKAWKNAQKCLKYVLEEEQRVKSDDQDICKRPPVAEDRAEIFEEWAAIGKALQRRGIPPLYANTEGKPLSEKKLIRLLEEAFNALVNGEPKLPRLPIVVKRTELLMSKYQTKSDNQRPIDQTEKNLTKSRAIADKLGGPVVVDYGGIKGYGANHKMRKHREKHQEMEENRKQMEREKAVKEREKAERWRANEIEHMRRARKEKNRERTVEKREQDELQHHEEMRRRQEAWNAKLTRTGEGRGGQRSNN